MKKARKKSNRGGRATAKNTKKPAGQPKVSVVVPIYNVEKYLHECVDSILAQTLKEIEVILVDDGSPDGCGKIVDEYARKDPRVVAIHQANGGYTKAVNRGFDCATGEYIGIIESDDFVEPDMYEKLYASAKKYDTDVTKGGFYYYNPTLKKSKQNVYYVNPRGVDLRKAPSGVFRAKDWPPIIAFHASIWSSIYRASLAKELKIPDTAGASYQDFPFMIEVMTKAQRISVVKKAFVHWRNEPNQGNSTSAGGPKLLLMGKNTLAGLKILQASPDYDALKEPFFAHALWANIGFFCRIDPQYKPEYFSLLREIFAPIRDDRTFTYRYCLPENKRDIKAINRYETWTTFRLAHIASGVRRRVRNVFARAKHLIYHLAGKNSEED